MKYDPLKLFSKDVKNALRQAMPDCRFSVRTIMGNSVDISLMKSPVPVSFKGYKWQNRGWQMVHVEPNRRYAMLKDNRQMLELWDKVHQIVLSIYNQKSSDTDHWCSYNYYLYFHIGRWKKPYLCTGG